jgi:hypothetical protein
MPAWNINLIVMDDPRSRDYIEPSVFELSRMPVILTTENKIDQSSKPTASVMHFRT